MPVTLSLLQFPLSQLQSLSLNGSSRPCLLRKPTAFSLTPRRTALPPIRAMKSLQGRVVCATNDKTVSVEVTRLAPHPKYKRRLEKSRPISKTKAFIAVPMPPRNVRKTPEAVPEDLGLPLESQQT
ncbi:ribosomal protein S17 [Actinidia rufa]|uniref:Ribosomal protein S17 n=1 Tax=Actinidia rufa TaxID=165716 RepID=A0A7J0FZN3_9ERIC|nr:ribosomal protein S17 [Actinidia rufa]